MTLYSLVMIQNQYFRFELGEEIHLEVTITPLSNDDRTKKSWDQNGGATWRQTTRKNIVQN